MSAVVRLAVVEDQAFTREVTIDRLRHHYGPDAEVEGFATVEELQAWPGGDFGVVVLDLHLREGALEGAEAVGAVARHYKVLVLSGLANGEQLERSQAAGAHGYVSKDTATVSTLIEAVDTVLAGGQFVDPDLLAMIGGSAHKLLTPRQQEVLRLEALGCKFRQIARALDPPLTEAGVRRHIERIVEIHPECARQADRVRLAIHLGLVSPWEVYPRPAGPVR